MEGFRREVTVSDLCRREGIKPHSYYLWTKEFMEAGREKLTRESVRDATRHEIQALRRENDEPKQLVAVVRCQGELIAGPARIAGLPAGDTVEVVRIVDGRGKGQSGGLFVRATARFAEAYRLAQDSRAWELLPSSRLFLPDGSTREGKTVTLPHPATPE